MSSTTETRDARAPLWPFAAVLLVFVLQHLVESQVGEPYPALKQPPFAGVAVDSSGRYALRTVGVQVVFADGSTTSIDSEVLLSQVPADLRPVLLRTHFRPEEDRRPPPDEFVAPEYGGAGTLERIGKTLLPGYVLAFRRTCCAGELPEETVGWLDDRLELLYPGRNPHEARFSWRRELVSVRGDSAGTRVVPDGSLLVSLSDPTR